MLQTIQKDETYTFIASSIMKIISYPKQARIYLDPYSIKDNKILPDFGLEIVIADIGDAFDDYFILTCELMDDYKSLTGIDCSISVVSKETKESILLFP